MTVDLWDEVVGQPVAVAQLRSAAAAPVHAYLLVGPEGSGTREAARAFAADLLAAGTDPSQADLLRTQVRTESHPALHVVEREGATMSADQLRDVVRLSATTPAAGSLRVFLIVEAHLLGQAAPMLLKSLEEPPASTVFVLTAEELPADLVTIESRCVRVDLDAVPEHVIAERLEHEGASAEVAAAAAAAAGGSMARGRLLIADPHVEERRQAWYHAPERLDGTGATVMTLVDELLGATDAIIEPLAARQAAELEELQAQIAAVGGKPRKSDLKSMEDRHAREQRRVRAEELRAGLAALVARYRDAAAAGGDPATFVQVADAVQSLCQGLTHNPRESLAVQALFVQLPPVRA